MSSRQSLEQSAFKRGAAVLGIRAGGCTAALAGLSQVQHQRALASAGWADTMSFCACFGDQLFIEDVSIY